MEGFNNLEMFFKKSFISNNCQFIIATSAFRDTVCLFAWESFLFELYYDRKTRDITCIRLASYKDFDKYLAEISLPEFFLAKDM